MAILFTGQTLDIDIMITTAYYSEDNHIYFESGGIVFRSYEKVDLPRVMEFNGRTVPGAVRYEGEVFGLKPCNQPPDVIAFAYDLRHPQDCVMDINCTINHLKHKVLDKGIISELRSRIKKKKMKTN